MGSPLILIDDIDYIDNTSPAFEGTKFSNFNFKIFFNTLTRSQEFAIEKKHSKRSKRGALTLNEPESNKEKFVKMVTDWEGIHLNKDEPFPCTNENKALLCEKFPPFTNLIMLAIKNNETGILDEADLSNEVDDKKENF